MGSNGGQDSEGEHLRRSGGPNHHRLCNRNFIAVSISDPHICFRCLLYFKSFLLCSWDAILVKLAQGWWEVLDGQLESWPILLT